MPVQRGAQRVGRHHALVAVGGIDHAGPVAIVLGQALQCRTAAAQLAHGDFHLQLAGNVAGLEHGRCVHAADEAAHIIIGRVAQDVFRRTHLHHHAILHDGDAVADAHGLVQIVRDEDDGALLFLLQAQQLALHLAADDGIQRGESLVHQQDGGVGRQRTGQAHALLHAAGKFVRIAVGPHFQTYLLQRLARLGMARGLVHAGQFQPEGRVVQHRQVRQQREGLEHHADVLAAKGAQLLFAVLADVLAIHQDAAGGRLDQAVEHAHQRGLARTGQAHDDEDFAGLDGETGVEHADGGTGLFHDLLLGLALAHQLQSRGGIIAEDLEQMCDLDFSCHAFLCAEAGGGHCCNGYEDALDANNRPDKPTAWL